MVNALGKIATKIGEVVASKLINKAADMVFNGDKRPASKEISSDGDVDMRANEAAQAQSNRQSSTGNATEMKFEKVPLSELLNALDSALHMLSNRDLDVDATASYAELFSTTRDEVKAIDEANAIPFLFSALMNVLRNSTRKIVQYGTPEQIMEAKAYIESAFNALLHPDEMDSMRNQQLATFDLEMLIVKAMIWEKEYFRVRYEDEYALKYFKLKPTERRDPPADIKLLKQQINALEVYIQTQMTDLQNLEGKRRIIELSLDGNEFIAVHEELKEFMNAMTDATTEKVVENLEIAQDNRIKNIAEMGAEATMMSEAIGKFDYAPSSSRFSSEAQPESAPETLKPEAVETAEPVLRKSSV